MGRLLNLSLACASFAIALPLALLLLQLIEQSLGADVTSDYLIEPRPRLWRSDPTLGYVNRPHLDVRAFGNVVGRTNAAGFRSARETHRARRASTLRIIGIGDSVTWGTRVNEDEAFLGLLRERLEDERAVEVINAAVIGYSTRQERVYLEQVVLPYAPDVVLVNFCTNDWLPSEDPFQNVGEIQRAWFRSLQEDPAGFDPTERALLGFLSDTPWKTLHAQARGPARLRALQEILIHRPVREMASLARAHGIRLVYLLIPSTRPRSGDDATFDALAATLRELGVEHLDFRAALAEDRGGYARSSPFAESGVARFLAATRLAALLDRLHLGALDPAPALANLGRLRDLRRMHEERNFIDDVGHPSRKGHRIIADALYDLFSESHPGS